MFKKILFKKEKKSWRGQPPRRLIKLSCTALSTTGLLFCLSQSPAIINRITANNWEALFEVVLTAGRGQCQFSVSASRLTLNLCLLIRAVQQPAGIWERVAALSTAVVSASVSPLLVSCPFCGHGLQEPGLVHGEGWQLAESCGSPGALLCAKPGQPSRAEFRRGEHWKMNLSQQKWLFWLCFISRAVCSVSSTTVHGCVTPFRCAAFRRVWHRIAPCSAPRDGGTRRICLLFFATERAGSLPENQIAWQEITKRLVSKSDFFPCEFFLLAPRQDPSWTALTEVVLITMLENVLWLAITAGWEGDSGPQQGDPGDSPHLSSLHSDTWVLVGHEDNLVVAWGIWARLWSCPSTRHGLKLPSPGWA